MSTTTRPPFDGRVHNSTLTRHAELRPGKPAPRKSRLAQGGALAKLGAARRTKTQASRQRQRGRYKHSATYREVERRAGGRCEYTDGVQRCEMTEGLEHHHKRYTKVRAHELPADMLVLCKRHHDLIESTFAHRRHGRHPR